MIVSRKEYNSRVKFLRSIGKAPSIDLRRRLSPSQKGSITRLINPIKYQFNISQRGIAIDFTPTTDVEILRTAERIWGKNSITKDGFFVPRGPLKKGNKRFIRVWIHTDEKTGAKSIHRKLGKSIEIYHPAPSKKQITEEGLRQYLARIELSAGTKNARYGFLVDKTVSKSFSTFSNLKERFNTYIKAILAGDLRIVGIIAMHS